MSTSTSIRDAVKMAAGRIQHDKLDDEIDRLIAVAKADLIRAGVDAEIVQADGSLVAQAVVTFCCKELTEEKDLIDKYEASYIIQADNLRKSSDVGDPAEAEEEADV